MLRRALAILAAACAILAGSLVAAAPASAAGSVWCNSKGDCYIRLDSVPSDPAPNPDANGWTPGAPTCYYETSESGAIQMGYKPEDVRVFDDGGFQQFYVIIDCGGDTTYWSNDRQCYVFMVDGAWPERPAYVNQEAGYYGCIMFEGNPGGGGPGLPGETNFWSNTVPPGLKVLTPGAAAAQLIATFQLRGIDIGMAPQVNPEWGHRRSYVGVPIWLWVENPEPLTWGPYSETATLGGQTITATAKVSGIRWDMGNGQSKVCGSVGTVFTVGYGLTDSPTCGYRYERTSEDQPGDRYTVTAVSMWAVTWTSATGASGTVNIELTSSEQLEVNELQSVIVKNPANDGSTGP